ncbi:MAG: hypothetical protein AB8B79_18635 [Granulosicoccus sp.]
MTGRSISTSTENVVVFKGFLDSSHRRKVSSAPVDQETATLLSIRQNLTYRAAVAVHNIADIRYQYPQAIVDEVLGTLRNLLSVEFGYLRVHRHNQVFIASHHCLESLIAGVLRVQFHGRQLELPKINVRGEQLDPGGVEFSWGVGTSVHEANSERQRRYKRNKS